VQKCREKRQDMSIKAVALKIKAVALIELQ
jgi:hypothetical protein